MKKILKSIITTLALTMLLGTTCFAAETSPQIYVDGYTVAETAAQFAQSFALEQASKPATTNSYTVCSNVNTVVIMINDTSSGTPVTQIISVVYNPVDKKAVSTVTTITGTVGSSQTVSFPMNIEVK